MKKNSIKDLLKVSKIVIYFLIYDETIIDISLINIIASRVLFYSSTICYDCIDCMDKGGMKDEDCI